MSSVQVWRRKGAIGWFEGLRDELKVDCKPVD